MSIPHGCLTDFSKILSSHRSALMGIAILSVMFYHQEWLVSGFWVYVKQFGYLGVELFLLISGYGIVHSLQKNSVGRFYFNRFLRLFPACISYGFIKLFLSYLSIVPQTKLFFLWDLLSLSHWYIYAIIVYYLIAPILYKTINKLGWLTLFIVIIISFTILCFWHDSSNMHYFLKYGRWILKRLPVFVLGMTLAIKPITQVRAFVIGAFGLILNFILYKLIVGINASSGIIDFPFRWIMYIPNRTDIPDGGRYIFDMMSILVICQFFSFITSVFKHIKLDKILILLGEYSLELYLCHQLIFQWLYSNIHIGFLEQIILAILTVLFATCFIKFLSKKVRLLLEYIYIK